VASREGDRERGNMTPHQRARRAEEVIEARARGLRWSTIAAQHGICERQAQRIYSDGVGSRLVSADRDALELAMEVLEQYEAVIEEFALLAQATAHDGVRLGAIRSRLDAMVSRAQLLTALGVLPHDLGQLKLVVEARAVAQTTCGCYRTTVSPRQNLWRTLPTP
jgi:small-conductance mechanosensitive channel